MMILSWQIAKKIWWQIAKKIWQVDKYMTSRLKFRTSQLLNYMYLTSGGRNMPSWMEQYITCDDIYMYKEYSSRRNMWVYDADNSIYMVALMNKMTSHLQTVGITLCSVRLSVFSTDRFVLVRTVTRIWTISFRKYFDAPERRKYITINSQIKYGIIPFFPLMLNHNHRLMFS